ncbi:putative chromo (CHRromatin Organisation MOdifier) domain containing protein [Lyophyllum shimeji]|uniref:Chromo (CHRromatin Organisation MOdifier) domain containing protein n=1 Tax=Lyophyllum shimeji TaxID=47721 RepID=A0A9P3PYB7_LYOSH|nr:putative chromo (CHRromatin Organisation MOdifier) domain containing protein [Lyophyllum shimeji]
MLFGMCNSLATFQTMMNNLLKELILRGKVMMYMDDILIYTETLAKHRKVVMEVLEILEKNKLYLKPEKCEFEKLEYLGIIIGEGKVEMDPKKLKAVRDWPAPRTVKETQSFLGFCNFYRKFIRDFATVAQPLYWLTRKNHQFKWTEGCPKAFDTLKILLTSAPVLTLPTDDSPYKIEADASDYASGAVLSQLQSKAWHPMAYLSKSFTAAERNYEIHDKEMLAIIRALKEWRYLVQGSRHKIEIWTDHKNLEYFLTARKLNRRQVRWSVLLADYDYTLKHRLGKTMLKPDALSRRPDHKEGVDNDNDDITLITPEHISALHI